MTALSAGNAALTEQIRDVLDREWPLPIPTLEVSARLGFDGYQLYAEVLRILNRLADRGEVEKIRREDKRSCYWRRWPE